MSIFGNWRYIYTLNTGAQKDWSYAYALCSIRATLFLGCWCDRKFSSPDLQQFIYLQLVRMFCSPDNLPNLLWAYLCTQYARHNWRARNGCFNYTNAAHSDRFCGTLSRSQRIMNHLHTYLCIDSSIWDGLPYHGQCLSTLIFGRSYEQDFDEDNLVKVISNIIVQGLRR